MDMLEFMQRFELAPTGTLVKAERLSLASDNERHGAILLTFSCGKTLRLTTYGPFRISDVTPGAPGRWVEWFPELPA